MEIREALFQWDVDKEIHLEDPSTVYMASVNSDVSYKVEPQQSDDGITAAIPNILLKTNAGLIVWQKKEDGSIEREFFYIEARPKPQDYIETEDEVRQYETLAARIDELEDQIENIEVGSYELPVASSRTLGGIKVGKNLTIAKDGTLDAPYATPGKDGIDGKDGLPGKDGTNGVDGKDGEPGKDGQDGYTPQKGIDYWTDADKAEIQTYINDSLGVVENGYY